MTMTIGGTSGLVFPDSSTQNTGATGFGFKNRIINGAMMIDQRNAGAAVSAAGSVSYALDRWFLGFTVDSKYTVQQNAGSVTPPVGFTNYLGVTSSSAYSVLSSDSFDIRQRIEGLNISDLAWGTANAATVTLTFKVYSSLTGTFGGSIKNSANNRSYPFTYTIPSANTWTTISVTVAGDTSGTWLTTNGIGMQVVFGLGAGSTYSGTAGAWASANYNSATGATSVVGTNGATFYITGVQLEKGSTATSFDYRPYGTELALCQRYFQLFASGVDQPIGGGWTFPSSTDVFTDIRLAQVMRTSPTIAQTATQYRVNSAGLNQTISASMTISPTEISIYAVRAVVTGFSGGTGGQGAVLRMTSSGYVAASAEL